MRKRAEIKKVSDIKKDPDFRLVFQKENYQDYLNFLSIGNQYAINPTTLARHLVLIFTRKVSNAVNKQMKDILLTEVMQSMHGLMQISIFEKPFNGIGKVSEFKSKALGSTLNAKQKAVGRVGGKKKTRETIKPKGKK